MICDNRMIVGHKQFKGIRYTLYGIQMYTVDARYCSGLYKSQMNDAMGILAAHSGNKGLKKATKRTPW